MRTTLTLDNDLAARLKEAAFRTGRPFKEVVNETLRLGLEAKQRPARKKRYRMRPAALGGVRLGINLDRALGVADALEDEAIAHKLELRK